MDYRRFDWSCGEAQRVAAGLLRLKNLLRRSKVPAKSASKLLVATWNVRELGRTYGGSTRSDEAIAYLAEVISAFDVVALQEVRNQLGDFKRLLKMLGPDYASFVTDITVGRPGNQERMAFVYDHRRVSFGGFAGQVVLPPLPGGEPAEQLARAPFMVGFRAGWFRFVICTAHIYYGTAVANDARRVAEIDALAKFLASRANDEAAWSSNYVVLGDFNVFSTEDETFKALHKSGFRVPKNILGHGSNVAGDKCFDQIAFMASVLGKRLDRAAGGVVNALDVVYRDADEKEYAAEMGEAYASKSGKKRTAYYRAWRTYKLSDHRPLWIELDVDFTRGFLANRMRGKPL